MLIPKSSLSLLDDSGSWSLPQSLSISFSTLCSAAFLLSVRDKETANFIHSYFVPRCYTWIKGVQKEFFMHEILKLFFVGVKKLEIISYIITYIKFCLKMCTGQ